MSGPPRNPDKLNTIGVVVVGICGAVLVYVTIVALQAFYMNDSSEVQTMADYGGQDSTAKGHKADEMRHITEATSNPVAPGGPVTYTIPIDEAVRLVIRDGKDPSHLVPALLPSTTPTIQPVFGRPKPLTAAPVPPEGAGSAAPAAGSAAPAAAGSAAGSAAPAAAGSAAAPAGAGSGQPAGGAAPAAPGGGGSGR
jgi:hypothetical protein